MASFFEVNGLESVILVSVFEPKCFAGVQCMASEVIGPTSRSETDD